MSAPSQIAHYRIAAKLGEGGMGEVWRATDTKLNRDVAIKILPEAFANDADRMARFQREAQVLASLNHPNIAAIYGIEQTAIVMELVEGKDLAGPLPIDSAIGYARQMAAGLEAAHEKGIVHRDLKPANIKVTTEGVVKLLDFGLARTPTQADEAATVTISMTQAGMIMGTAGYMSPEQARGLPVDKRTDIWAFGVVLFEMLTGKQLFARGETLTDILASVVTREPDWSALPADTPRHIRRLLERCLQKDPKLRLRDIGEARIAIEQPAAPAESSAQPRGTSRFPWLLAAVFAAIAVTTTVAWRLGVREEPRTTRFFVPSDTAFPEISGIAVSPDGRHLAFIATSGGVTNLWVRDFDTLNPRLLTGTEGAHLPFWSPDSRHIGFHAAQKLKRIDIEGGTPIPLCDVSNLRGASWSSEGVILFSPSSAAPLYRIPASGGTPVQVTTLPGTGGENSHRWPWFLPDGRHFLYTARNDHPGDTTIYMADLESKGRTPVLAAASNAVYVKPGLLLYARERSLLAQAFDSNTGRLSGEPRPLVSQVDYINANQQAVFAASEGVLAYISGGAAGDNQLTWLDAAGKTLAVMAPPAQINGVAISPDGKMIADSRRDPQANDFEIWIHDLAHNTSSPLTFGPTYSTTPRWSWDSGCIAYSVGGGPGFQRGSSIAAKPVAGGPEQTLLDVRTAKTVQDWSPDGRYLVYQENDPDHGRGDLWLLPLLPARPGACPAAAGRPRPFLQTPFDEHDARISPDGRWILYVSDESRRNEVYVQSFPIPGSKGQISTEGGGWPTWSRDGKVIYYVNLKRELVAVPVDVRGTGRFVAAPIKVLFQLRGSPTFEPAPDTKRFLTVSLRTNVPNSPISVVMNWAGTKK